MNSQTSSHYSKPDWTERHKGEHEREREGYREKQRYVERKVEEQRGGVRSSGQRKEGEGEGKTKTNYERDYWRTEIEKES